jgi:hypothetical protein
LVNPIRSLRKGVDLIVIFTMRKRPNAPGRHFAKQVRRTGAPMSNPAAIRHEREKRAAVRSALARPVVRLDQKQLKLCLAEHDALGRKSNALFAEHGKVFDGTPAPAQDPALDRVYAAALRRLDQLDKQIEAFDARAAALRAHPQIIAAMAERGKKAERRS